MFRKPKRNIRQRVITNDSDDENDDSKMETEDNLDHIQILPEPLKKKKEKKPMHKSSSVLSFDSEEGKLIFRLDFIIKYTLQLFKDWNILIKITLLLHMFFVRGNAFYLCVDCFLFRPFGLLLKKHFKVLSEINTQLQITLTNVH